MMLAFRRERSPVINQALLYLILACLVFGTAACSSVKPYQRAYLNDSEMEMGVQPVAQFDESVHAYREGASGGIVSKGSGGCGCN